GNHRGGRLPGRYHRQRRGVFTKRVISYLAALFYRGRRVAKESYNCLFFYRFKINMDQINRVKFQDKCGLVYRGAKQG
ncbi:hypothetical protein, partial [Franconibacter helveticus]|uniref:hypothetical protein n=1 Tax=Franconibacter helveticus TaxID=357240 RepID=UPI000560BBC4